MLVIGWDYSVETLRLNCTLRASASLPVKVYKFRAAGTRGG
jgi:hypothetical protein